MTSGDDAGRPRITFTMFRSSDDPALHSWVRFRDSWLRYRMPAGPVPGLDGAPEAAGEGTAPASASPLRADRRPAGTESGPSGFWRLLASNNRELGRSFLLYRSFAHARSHVDLVKADADALEVVYVSGPHQGARGWVITHEGAPVLTCSRWYDSLSARASAAAGALAALPSARVAGVPDRSGPSGRFVRRTTMEKDAAIW